MRRPALGVVIGKFYPPHEGHHALIDFAQTRAEKVAVIVCDHQDQRVPGEIRASWLREIHPNVSVFVTPDDLPEEPEPWADRTVQILGTRPDVVVTSEDYGPAYAAAMGAEHVLFDSERIGTPISATAIRRDALRHWEFLREPVKRFLAIRIVLIGSESTGKTTLAQRFATELNTVWVPEYGREHASELVASGRNWRTADFVTIAQRQRNEEDRYAGTSNGVLICDTDAVATGVWHERYMGFRSSEVEEIGEQSVGDLYLLSAPDFPFVQDGTRDGEHLRQWMHERLESRVAELGLLWVLLSGTFEDRYQAGLDAIALATRRVSRFA